MELLFGYITWSSHKRQPKLTQWYVHIQPKFPRLICSIIHKIPRYARHIAGNFVVLPSITKFGHQTMHLHRLLVS
jgi:hypothetical protein